MIGFATYRSSVHPDRVRPLSQIHALRVYYYIRFLQVSYRLLSGNYIILGKSDSVK